jgi:predicted PurR-regulated permease PerM
MLCSVMILVVAAAAGGLADFIVGLLIGVFIGFLVRPAVGLWMARREWRDASRQANLTDEVLARMEQDLRPRSG